MSNELTRKAVEARELAIAPFSGFKVGAALEAADGRIFTGCNIENASYGLTVCAERVALLKALSEGVREFRAIVVATDADTLTYPCGACRQLLWEYCGDIAIHLYSTKGHESRSHLLALLPHPFDRNSLEKRGQAT